MPGIDGIEVASGAPARPVNHALGVLPRPLTAHLLAPLGIPTALALITFLVFVPALWNGFVEWDDQVNLYENPAYRGLSWPEIRWMFSNVTMGHWIPLTWLTFGLDF